MMLLVEATDGYEVYQCYGQRVGACDCTLTKDPCDCLTVSYG